MKKYVFASEPKDAEWNNSSIIRGDAIAEITQLKKQQGGNLLAWGHGIFARALLKNKLTDLLDISVHPVLAGNGKLFFTEVQALKLRLAGAKSFSKIVKLTYEPQY